MKNQRQEKIKQLISQFDIETQDELIERLHHEGVSATQATISRDIREMKISKVLGGNGKYHYATAQGVSPAVRHSYIHSIRSVSHAGNLVVVKTGAGFAQAVAAELDSMEMGEILGCVAGDDTIIAVAASDSVATEFCATLSRKVGLN